ncbi:MAG: radical SAM protein [Bacilli bacterium]
MNTLLIGINSKYIHPNMAIRLLKANVFDFSKVDIHEWTIKDSYIDISTYIMNRQDDLIGFSCYIWNIELIKQILTELKNSSFQGQILLGGPEVSYNYDEYFTNYGINYIIINEGEQAFLMLLKALSTHHLPLDIPNLVTPTHKNPAKYITNLDSLASPYFDLDYKYQIMYIEASRGCPYHCSYCMASLEKKVRTFNLERVKDTILQLLNQGARTFKFLDRTFNLDTERTLDLFQFIIKQAPKGSSFQFEITGDLLPLAIIDYLNNNAPKGLIRFEIGIQSTNSETNHAIGRDQNTPLLFKNICALQQVGKIAIHLDLIAGLPYEDLTSFKQTFDEAMALRPLELQLGFLKFLKGTRIFKEAEIYQYQWDLVAPYEFLSNHVMGHQERAIIHTAENACEKYYNSPFLKQTIHFVLDRIPSAFQFFFELGQYYESKYAWIGYNLDELLARFFEFIQTQPLLPHEEILFLMKQDYLNHFSLKPKIWWPRPGRNHYHKITNDLLSTHSFPVSSDDIFRYGLVETYQNHGFIIIYKPNNKQFLVW